MAISPQRAAEHVPWPERELKPNLRGALDEIEAFIDRAIAEGAAATQHAGEKQQSVVSVPIGPVLRNVQNAYASDEWPVIAWELVQRTLEWLYKRRGWAHCKLNREREKAYLYFPGITLIEDDEFDDDDEFWEDEEDYETE